MKKNVQIPFPVFRKLLLFHLRHREEYAGEIAEYLKTKLESMVQQACNPGIRDDMSRCDGVFTAQ